MNLKRNYRHQNPSKKRWSFIGRRSAAFCCLIFFCAGISCSKPPLPISSNRLRIAFHSYPSTIDPRQSADFLSGTLICMTYEGLTRMRPDGGLDLAVADRIDLSSDQSTYVFHLKPSRWSDGTPVTAYDFEKSWKQQLSCSFPSSSAYLFYPIKNAQKAYKGLASLEEVEIKALDALTLRVELERPTPWFLSLVAFPSFFPIPSHMETQYSCWNQNESGPLVSNGPFCVRQARANAEIELLKNELFWNADCVSLHEIHIAIIGSETTAMNLFEEGSLDWIGGAICPLPQDSLKELKTRKLLSYNPIAATTFCSFNTAHPLLKNKCLRKALSLSINRQNLIENLLQAQELSATRCIPPSLMGGRNKVFYQDFDPEMARLYFDKALKELQATPEELNSLGLSVGGNHLDLQIAQALQRQWKETLGLDISIHSFEFKSFRDLLYKKNYELALTFWIAQFGDPINILERFVEASNAKNYPGWSHPTFVRLVQQSTLTQEYVERLELIEAAEGFLLDEMPFAPIYHWSSASLAHPKIKDLKATPCGGVLFEYCKIQPDNRESACGSLRAR